MKEKKKPKGPRLRDVDRHGELEWTPLFSAFKEAFEWALDVAAALARDYPEEVDAVERVRAFMRARIAGDTSHVRVDDILFTFGLLIAAIERDLGPIGVQASWFAPPLQLRFPSALDWIPHVPRRFHAFTHLSAA